MTDALSAAEAERDGLAGQLAKVREASKALICDRDASFMRDVFAALAASPTTGPAPTEETTP